ncbi:MAG: ammonium transporter [Verrucomicrobia bacterium]|nr:ammonium transporter [Verrucomicrobiota bacterium]
MRKILVLGCLLVAFGWLPVRLHAAVPPPAKMPQPTLDQRLADIEAYINNVPRATDGRAVSRIAGPGPAHNGWMMTCSALVLFMTLPGLALFYGGLVRRKNVLSVLAQCLGIAGVVTIFWWLCGYSLTFSHGSGLLGNLDFAFFSGVDAAPNADYSPWISQNVFCMYQLMFAIITPALIVGAIAERMRYPAVLLFVVLWMLVIYFPVAHMVWGVDGVLNGLENDHARIRALDFAGGIVVHMTSGWSALALCLLVGRRLGHGREQMPPHSMVLCMVGTGMLWVGWYGFNAGSALAADTIAANAFVATTLAAAVGCSTWGLMEYCTRGRLSVLGLCSGAVAGLATITPASGFVTPNAAVLIGLLAGVLPFLACNLLKARFGYDDALDTFGVHAVGGTLGVILTGLLASPKANANLAAARIQPLIGHTLWLHQLAAAAIVLVLSVVGTVLLAHLVHAILRGLRVSEEVETLGLDLAEHGEEGYIE